MAEMRHSLTPAFTLRGVELEHFAPYDVTALHACYHLASWTGNDAASEPAYFAIGERVSLHWPPLHCAEFAIFSIMRARTDERYFVT